MSDADSIVDLLRKLEMGDEEAANQIWEECFPRLLQIARRQLEGTPRKIADEEDVALSALKSFCKATRNGCFPDLKDRDGLWRLLFTITTRKAIDLRRYEGRRPAQRETDFQPAPDETSPISKVPAKMSEEEVGAQLAEELEQRLGSLDSDEYRIITAKLEGYTNEEIARQLKIALRTVERKLQLTRRRWEKGMNG
ncbi:ECF-type sigma factor [Blastopirellula marina]|uniref:RNA polymerase subunit sigma-70 n=1 Tax=Blastopirellula marina TaxID=124 RepID=A0A2S8GN08_9BACT|nr:ECF-type sigma factor [Blastopirellula marina]PQO45823.1 RNA polymerase subunit sigma-70 [Blastopirellula marina]